ncbi:MAG: ketose-bisphosphate aldolase [Deltaproteobacteria bacterium]|nr:MAG: ketose-bisphosphate aldolase [Deltaproteobacteria bacterium]
MLGRSYERALDIGRPPNVKRLFPNSRALIVSGKYVDRAMLEKGHAIALAANARNHFVIRGALQAAQRAQAAMIIEIARSEGGTNAYCAVNLWNLARQVDAVANELGITVPVAVHADHYTIKKWDDVAVAKQEIPTLFEQGVTSIAIDASHLAEDENVFANLELVPFVPAWAGLETEVGEIKGAEGLSTKEDALFHIRALNARGVFPDWIALNNGTTHGIQASDQGIQVDLTAEIHEALEPYKVSGAQHGTSGNNSERLREIARRTRTTKANVATALQFLSWGVEVNDYGNAQVDEQGRFIKIPGEGVTEEMWQRMVAYAEEKGWKGGNYKKLNLPFENLLLAQPEPVRQRMAKRVENFCYRLITEVFNAAGTADLVIKHILESGSHDPGPKVRRIEKPSDWTDDQISKKARKLSKPDTAKGDWDD